MSSRIIIDEIIKKRRREGKDDDNDYGEEERNADVDTILGGGLSEPRTGKRRAGGTRIDRDSPLVNAEICDVRVARGAETLGLEEKNAAS